MKAVSRVDPQPLARQRSRPAVAPPHARGTGPALRPAQRNAPRHRLSQKRQSRLLPDAPAPFPRQVRPEAARDGYAHGHLPPGGQSQEGGGKINGQGLQERGPRPCPWADSSPRPSGGQSKRDMHWFKPIRSNMPKEAPFRPDCGIELLPNRRRIMPCYEESAPRSRAWVESHPHPIKIPLLTGRYPA